MIRLLERGVKGNAHDFMPMAPGHNGVNRDTFRAIASYRGLSRARLRTMIDPTGEQFLDSLSSFDRFAGVADAANYQPLPDGWWLATADIVGSTKAIAAGRYKAVNMAGASVISAILNTLGRRNIPFVFGGDGALVAVPDRDVEKTRTALAAVQTWAAEELQLSLRAALVPMSDIRKHGHDVRVARFQAAPEAVYAMISGGGASWAEREMKAGRYAIQPAPPGTHPDLTGLSCRWNPIAARNGEMVSIIVLPEDDADPAAFSGLVSRILAVLEQDRGGHPLAAEGPTFTWPPAGYEYEARAWRRGPLFLRRIGTMAAGFISWAVLRAGRKIGSFDPKVYIQDTVSNSDFRKFDDGLKLTVDIDAGRRARIEDMLGEASREGLCRFGIHCQSSALMTCLVPSPRTRDHLHFIDGAAGGYAVAAANMKAKA
jgi:hypothetical protein